MARKTIGKAGRKPRGHGGGQGTGGATNRTLTVSIVGNGRVTDSTGQIDTSIGNFSGVFVDGSTATLTGTPDPNNSLAWSGDGTGTGQQRTVLMTGGNKSVTATFSAIGGGGVNSEVPGTGAVLKEDLATIEDPTVQSLWQSYYSPYSDSENWTSDDDSVQRLSASPDPHIAIDQGSASTYYRQLKTLGALLDSAVSGTPTTVTVDDCSEWPDSARGSGFGEGRVSIKGVRSFTYTSRTDTQLQGCAGWTGTTTTFNVGDKLQFQSPFDAGVPNTATRTQILKHSTIPGNCFYQMTNGNDYIWYTSIRFEHPTPLVGISSTTGRSQVIQYKEYPNPGSQNPIFAITERQTDLNLLMMGTSKATIDIDKSVGFIRFAVAFRMSTTAGRVQLWGDLAGDGDMIPLTSVINTPTLVNSSGMGIPSCGPYHNLGVGPLYRHYANIQICDFTWS